MTLDRAGDFFWIAGAMMLVGSALIARRNASYGPKWRMAFVWFAIFAVLFGIAHMIDAR